MEDNKKLYPSLPSNYVTIVDLQKRWMQQKQQQQQQQQEEEEHVKGDKHEQNHKVQSNKIIHDEVVKPRSQFRKFNRPKSDVKPNFKTRGSFHGKLYDKKVAKGFPVVEKASDSSGINAATANHIISNEDGNCEENNSQFQKSNCSNSDGNLNFHNRKSYRNFNGKKRFKELPVVKKMNSTVAEKSMTNVENSQFQNSNCSNSDGNPNFDNRKSFDRNFNGKKRFKEFPVVKKMSSTVAEKSMTNIAIPTTECADQEVEDKKKKIKMRRKKNKKRNQKVVDECCEDETREKEGEKLVNDQSNPTVEEKDNQITVEDQKVEEKDNQVIVEDRTVEEKDMQVTVEDQTVIMENQTVEEKENPVIAEDHTVEIEQKFKKVSVSRLNGRSTAVMEEKRREYGGYRGGYRRGYGKRSWEVERRKTVVVDQVSGGGRSTAEVGGWRGMRRRYGGVANRGKSFRRNVESIILGFQHSFLTLGIITHVSSLIIPQMGGSNHDKAKVIQSMMFVSAINTLVQTLVGTRLPVVIGASHAFVIPMTSLAFRVSCTSVSQTPQQTFERTMTEMQGALLVASVIQIILGFSGIWRLFVRFLSPLSMVPLVSFSGLGLFSLGFPMLTECVEIGLPHLIIMLIFSQYLSSFLKTNKLIFDRSALIFSTAIVWIYALILTASGVYNNRPLATQLSCRTDRAGLIHGADWVYLPRPFQWGKPTVNLREATPMVFAGLVALIESTGIFIAAARYASATPVPPSVIGRGTFWLGVGTLLNGVFGAVAGPTASPESAGLLGLTRVGSRRVIQISAGFILLFSIFGKFTAFFASVPFPIMAASYCILYAYVSSAGLNHLQFCNLNSFRSLFILGFSSFMAISVPQHFKDYMLTSNSSPLQTRSKWLNGAVASIFISSPAVAMMVGIMLDNTMNSEEQASRHDSGKHWWERFIQFTKDIRNAEFYSLPCSLNNCFPSL